MIQTINLTYGDDHLGLRRNDCQLIMGAHSFKDIDSAWSTPTCILITIQNYLGY